MALQRPENKAVRGPEKDGPVILRCLSLTSKKMKILHRKNQNTEPVILAMDWLRRETSNDRIAVVLDNAGFHHAKVLKDMLESDDRLASLELIYLPPHAPNHNPSKHVWNATKGAIANIQCVTPEETFGALTNPQASTRSCLVTTISYLEW